MLTVLIVSSVVAASAPRRVFADDAKEALQGVWAAQSMEADGRSAPPKVVEKMQYTFKGDKLLIRGNFANDREEEASYEIDADKSPKYFQFTPPRAPKPVLGIYELKGDELKICLRHGSSSKGRPTEFASKPGSEQILIVFKKQGK
jgi:uncharacterized protein (TIGR03067 family)